MQIPENSLVGRSMQLRAAFGEFLLALALVMERKGRQLTADRHYFEAKQGYGPLFRKGDVIQLKNFPDGVPRKVRITGVKGDLVRTEVVQ